MTSRPLLLVDGYNVIAVDPGYRVLFDEDQDTARARLVEDVAGFAEGRYDAVVVFDAHGNPASDGEPHDIAGVTVIFSPAGTDADSVIEGLAHHGSGEGRSIVLATSDSETQRVATRENVRRMSSPELLHAIATEAEERSSHAGGPYHSRLEDRIDPRTREALFRWARGS